MAERKGIALDGTEVRVQREDTDDGGKAGSRFVVRIDLGAGLAERERKLLFHVAQHCHVHKLLTGPMDFQFELAGEGADGSEMVR